MTASTHLPLPLNPRKTLLRSSILSEMPWTDGVPEELVEKLEAKNAVCIYRRDSDFWMAPERDLRLNISRRVAGADARRSRWEGV
jgi:hypothetical protein